jgi:hypothetical protein
VAALKETAFGILLSRQGTSHVPEAWSPDGKVLLFAAVRDGIYTLQSYSTISRNRARIMMRRSMASCTRLMPPPERSCSTLPIHRTLPQVRCRTSRHSRQSTSTSSRATAAGSSAMSSVPRSGDAARTCSRATGAPTATLNCWSHKETSSNQYFRNDDDPTSLWQYLRDFGYPVPQTEKGPTPRSVTFI